MTNEEAKKAAEARGLKPGTSAYTKFLRDQFLGRDSNKGTKDNIKKLGANLILLKISCKL